jgi:Family of unknown function (DUF5681)
MGQHERRRYVGPDVAVLWWIMSETEVTGLKQRAAHLFRPGQSGNPAGRPRGSKSKLSENFLADLHACWERHGVEALERCATEEPSTLIKVIASLLPKDVRIDLTLDATTFADKLQQAAALLGHDIDPPRRPRKPLPGQPRLIENGDGR